MVLTTNLISYYKFDSDANDSVGTNNGTVAGAILATGKINDGYYFDGSNDVIYMDTPDSGGYGYNTYWINLWVNLVAKNSGERLWYTQQDSTNKMGIYFSAGGNLVVYVITGGFTRLDENTGISLDLATWYMITFQYDGANYKIYINGTLQWTSATTSYGMHLMATPVTSLAAIYGTPATNCVECTIDEYGFWGDETPTQAELDELYHSGTGYQYPFVDSRILNTKLGGIDLKAGENILAESLNLTFDAYAGLA